MQIYKTLFITMISLLYFLTSIQAQPLTHTLQEGDTLYSISKKYAVTVDEIMSYNGISSPQNLSIGFILKIPGRNSEKDTDNSGAKQYIVQRGDTFYRIAKNHGLTVNELFGLNDFDNNKVLKPGDVLIVSSSSGRNPVSDPKPEPKPEPLPTGFGGSHEWPVEGVKQSMAGKTQGVKILAAEASMVRSVASGEVVWIGPYRGYGKVVLVDVKGYIYMYGGNEDVFVNVGESVNAGMRIGRLGHSEMGTRTVNMYFSVFKDGIPVSVVSAPRG